MKTQITIRYPASQTTSTTEVNIDEYCPHCGLPGQPRILYTMTASPFDNITNTVGIFTQCPRSECEKFNVQAFEFRKSRADYSSIVSVSEKTPYSFKPLLKNDLPREINDVFPDFKDIYTQSLEAESLGFDQIAGIGFRKALEFLVKSYAIQIDPESKRKIEKESLGNTINNRYKEFPKIQKLAELATWIGNDETHFVRKHTTIDIEDMKRFIRSASLFIAADMDAEFATSYIEKDKTKKG